MSFDRNAHQEKQTINALEICHCNIRLFILNYTLTFFSRKEYHSLNLIKYLFAQVYLLSFN
jgi:hypothetical protein